MAAVDYFQMLLDEATTNWGQDGIDAMQRFREGATRLHRLQVIPGYRGTQGGRNLRQGPCRGVLAIAGEQHGQIWAAYEVWKGLGKPVPSPEWERAYIEGLNYHLLCDALDTAPDGNTPQQMRDRVRAWQWRETAAEFDDEWRTAVQETMYSPDHLMGPRGRVIREIED